MKYKTGDILKGEINGREFQIIACTGKHYRFIDLKTKKAFISGHKTLERCAVIKVQEKEA